MSPMTVTDPRFDTTYQTNDGPPQRRNKWGTCLIGCFAVLGMMLLLAIIFGVWVARNWQGWIGTVADQALSQAIDTSDLPAAEKQELRAEVRRVTDVFRDKRISMEQLGQIIQGVMSSPLMPLFVVTAIEKQYLDQSGLNDKEKAEGRRSLQRFVRGAADKKIDQKGIDAVMAHIADRKQDGTWQIRQKVSDEDLRAALKEAKAQADAAEIPEEPEEFDPSDELRKIIDKSLGEAGAMPAQPGAR